MRRSLVLGCGLFLRGGGSGVAVAQSSIMSTQQGDKRRDETAGPPIIFFADLSADEESSEVYSPGVGRFEASLDRKTLKLTWKVTYSNLTTPIKSAGIHGPQTVGGEAAVLMDLAKGTGLGSPIQGSQVINEGELEYLLTGRLYVNILTSKYPSGELRGQINRQRPKAPTT